MFSSLLIVACTSDSLQAVLSHLSAGVENVLTTRCDIGNLTYLLTFLKAWDKRPDWLTPMAYRWCSMISEVAKGAEPIVNSSASPIYPSSASPVYPSPYVRQASESGFFDVGPGCDHFRLGTTPHHALGPLGSRLRKIYTDCLFLTTAIAFRQVDPESLWWTLSLDHTPHHDWMFEVAFSSYYDDTVADAVSVWIAGGADPPPGSFLRRFSARVENPEEFSPRLRSAALRVLEGIWRSELEASWFETVRLLDRLEVGVEDISVEYNWTRLLESVICSPAGPEGLSPHYWCLLDKLVRHTWGPHHSSVPRYLEVMRSLEEAESWENLEIWIKVMWRSEDADDEEEMVKDVERVTLKLLSHRSSALPRFRDLSDHLSWDLWNRLRRICDQAEQLPSELPP